MAKKKGTENSAAGGQGKRAYTMSPKALAQRRAAAVKDGQHAQLAGGVAPCKRSACPGEYPCSVKTAASDKGRGLSVCLPSIGSDSELAQRYLAAMEGDLAQVRPLAASALATHQELFDLAAGELRRDGFGIRKQFMGPDGQALEKIIPNPAARSYMGLSELLGHTAQSWLTTPAARGDEAAKKGLVDLAEHFANRRKRLAAAT